MIAIKLIIFDMDGTLTQTNELIFESFNYIARRYTGRTYSDEEITAMFGPPEEGALRNIVGEDRLEGAFRQYLDFYRSNHERFARAYPGIGEILQQIKGKGIKLALFTGKGRHTTSITLEKTGLTRYFDMVVTGNDVDEHKPSSEGIRKILTHFGVDPEHAVMIGDSVGDVKAARDAGVKIAAALWDSYGKEKVERLQSDFVFHSIKQLDDWVRAIPEVDATS